MRIASIKIEGVHGEAFNRRNTIAGTIGDTISLDFSPEWDGLLINATFKASNITGDVINIDPMADLEIPPEISALPHRKMMVSFQAYGLGEVRPRMNTPYIYLGDTCVGGNSDEDPSTNPSNPVWQQLMARIGDIRSLNTKCKNTAVCAINECLEIVQSVRDDADSGALNGDSAYDIAVQHGFNGTEQQWLDTLRYDHSEEFQGLSDQVREYVRSAAESAGSR